MAQITQLPPSYPSTSARFGAGLAQYLQQALAQQQQQQAIKKQYNDIRDLNNVMSQSTGPNGVVSLNDMVNKYEPNTKQGLNAIMGLFNQKYRNMPIRSEKQNIDIMKQQDPAKYADYVGKIVRNGLSIGGSTGAAYIKKRTGMDVKAQGDKITINNKGNIISGTSQNLLAYEQEVRDKTAQNGGKPLTGDQLIAIATTRGVGLTIPGVKPVKPQEPLKITLHNDKTNKNIQVRRNSPAYKQALRLGYTEGTPGQTESQTAIEKEYAFYKKSHPEYSGSLLDFKKLYDAKDPKQIAMELASRDFRVLSGQISLSGAAQEYLNAWEKMKGTGVNNNNHTGKDPLGIR